MKIQSFPFSLSELRRYLLVDKISDTQIVNSIKSTQKNFTVSRDKIEGYSKSKLDVSSYSLFYMPTDFPKLSMVLRELPEALINMFQKSYCDVFDVGCGPGTFSFAWRTFFPGAKHQFHLIDQSKEMWSQAKKFSESIFNLPQATFGSKVKLDSISTQSGVSLRVAIFGHSINEMGLSIAREYISQINPDYIIMLGPGTPAVFSTFMEWRDIHSLKDGFEILYPCLAQKPCPMLKENYMGDWCHQILREKLSAELHQLGQKLSIDRRSIAFIGHIYCRRGEIFNEQRKIYSLVRFLGETKFSWQYLGCSAENEELVKLEVMKKGLSKEDSRLISSLLVGQRIEFEIQREISSKHFRGAIK